MSAFGAEIVDAAGEKQDNPLRIFYWQGWRKGFAHVAAVGSVAALALDVAFGQERFLSGLSLGIPCEKQLLLAAWL